MGIKNFKADDVKCITISKTAYRSLLLLKLLLKSSLTKTEILKVFENDIVLNKRFADDTLTATVNTLRKSGCVIKRPSPANDFKYVLADHPFRLQLSDANVVKLNNTRRNASFVLDYQTLFDINSLYKKLAQVVYAEEKRYSILKDPLLVGVDEQVINVLGECCAKKNTISIEYSSKLNQSTYFDFITDEIRYENGRLYLWGYSLKYNEYSYLRVDKVKDIKKIFDGKKQFDKSYTLEKIRYKLIGNSLLTFLEEDYETVIESTKSHLIVDAAVKNRFNFIQRILFYGADCTIISPDVMKDEIVEQLRLIKERYKDDCQQD